MSSAVERWHALIDARAQQMDAAYARLGRTSADFWNRRARGFHRATKTIRTDDPFLLAVRKDVTQFTMLLDVGAGTGRFTVALAPYVQHVTAVEPNQVMLGYLQQDVVEQGISNVSTLQTSWEAAPDTLAADVVICSHVLYPIREVVPFLTKLDAATRQKCYLYLRATQLDSITAPIWQHFHGEARCLQPSYIDAVDVLYEMGIYANVQIVSTPNSLRYPSLEVAVEELTEQLILPDDEQTHHTLYKLLQDWLVEEEDGLLVPPINKLDSAIVSWNVVASERNNG